MNTTEFLTISAAIVPDRVSMIFEGKRITFEEMQSRVNRLANALADLGVGAGDRVAMLQVNCNQYIEAYFACGEAGRCVRAHQLPHSRGRADAHAE